MVLKIRLVPPTLFLWHLCFSTSLLIFRVFDSNSYTYLFLIWNLFLAYVPWYISGMLNRNNPGFINMLLLGLWLLFFPNAPYLLTDHIHLHLRPSHHYWLDLSIFFSFALNGLAIGFLSLNRVHRWLKAYSTDMYAWIFTQLALTLGAFGMYLGRVERWNSWDLLLNPQQLLHTIGALIMDADGESQVWYFTLLFGLFLSMHYHFFLYISYQIKKPPHEDPA